MATNQHQTPTAMIARQAFGEAVNAHNTGQQKLVGPSALLSIAASLLQIAENLGQPLPVERVAQGCGCAPTPAPGYAARCDLCTAQTWIYDPALPQLLPEGWTTNFNADGKRVFYCPDDTLDDEGDEL